MTSQPRTAAGRDFAEDGGNHLSSCWVNSPQRVDQECDCGFLDIILAIEAEAAGSEGLRAALERLMEAVRSVVSPHETSVDAYTVLWDPMAQADAALAAQPAESGK